MRHFGFNFLSRLKKETSKIGELNCGKKLPGALNYKRKKLA